jgi:hypothetical protein
VSSAHLFNSFSECEGTPNTQKTKVDFRMGVVADIQCCDIDDGFNYARTVQRRYRGALQMLDRAVPFWNKKYKSLFYFFLIFLHIVTNNAYILVYISILI